MKTIEEINVSHIRYICYSRNREGTDIMNRTNGKIAEQSRMKIAKALLVIMKQYNFKEITITQLTQEAGLSRKTFYRLFTDKEDVLSYLFENLYMECLAQIKSRKIQHYWDVVQCYFDFWQERKPLLLLLKQNNLLSVLFEGAYKYSFEIFEYIRSRDVMDKFSLQLPYMLAYSVGGMHSMLLKWVENDMIIPSHILIEQLKTGFKSAEI